METKVTSRKQEIVISYNGPTRLIGERINPTGKKKLAAALRDGAFDVVRQEAISQVEAGADILDVNASTPETDEISLLPRVLEIVMNSVDVPLCIDINNPAALKEALKVYEGKPIVNSVSGEDSSLREILPLVKEYGTAVIGLTLDDKGIPKEEGKRLEIANKIIETAESYGIPREDIIIDCLSLTVGADNNAGIVTIGAVQKVREMFGVNQTLGASNVSYGLPDRVIVNNAYLSLVLQAGVTCPTVDADKVRPSILATDLLLGRDRFAMRYISDFNKRRK
ncbi:MAG: dihydropteroate synthase [Deltaproteobacteria bacterium]|nr:dihydropteroate synthase [Deltaproteobacteria bacterium]